MIEKTKILFHLKQLYLKRIKKDNFLPENNLLELIYPFVIDYLDIINRKKTREEIPVIFILETHPIRFISAFFAGIISESSIFLINPHWQKEEWQQINSLVKPDLIFGKFYYNFLDSKKKFPRFKGIMIPTGGTSGNIKFAIHTWETLTNSALSFARYFKAININSFCCLPLYHVSGLMQVIRSFITQGSLIIYNFNYLKNYLINDAIYQNYFISLVPTQLQFFLDRTPYYLQQFYRVLVGGAFIYPSQIALAKKYQIPLALTYGMTETASGISILNTEEVMKNNLSNGKILSHVEISIEPQKGTKEGIIKIKSSSLFKGYYPEWEEKKIFITDDIGYLDEEKFIYILGRNSQKIITGGENVFPLEVEKAILKTNLVKEVYITSEKNDYWGEIIIAYYVPINEKITEEEIKLNLKSLISHYKIPKIWHKLSKIPRNSQGKINPSSFAL